MWYGSVAPRTHKLYHCTLYQFTATRNCILLLPGAALAAGQSLRGREAEWTRSRSPGSACCESLAPHRAHSYTSHLQRVLALGSSIRMTSLGMLLSHLQHLPEFSKNLPKNILNKPMNKHGQSSLSWFVLFLPTPSPPLPPAVEWVGREGG